MCTLLVSHSRVKLTKLPQEEHSDYINANFITVTKHVFSSIFSKLKENCFGVIFKKITLYEEGRLVFIKWSFALMLTLVCWFHDCIFKVYWIECVSWFSIFLRLRFCLETVLSVVTKVSVKWQALKHYMYWIHFKNLPLAFLHCQDLTILCRVTMVTCMPISYYMYWIHFENLPLAFLHFQDLTILCRVTMATCMPISPHRPR